MTPAARLTTRAQRDAFRSVKRACYAGLDSLELRQQVRQRAAAIVSAEAFALVAIDPDTGLFSHALVDIPDGLGYAYMTEVYPREAGVFIDLARSGLIASTENSSLLQDVLRVSGLEHGLHTALASEGEIWGSWCMFREPASPSFRDQDADFLRAIAGPIADGLRTAALVEEARTAEAASRTTAPGVVVIDRGYRITMRAGPAAAQLDDLGTVGSADDALPYALMSLLARLRGSPADGTSTSSSELRAQGRSGQWYILHAALAEPDSQGDSAAVIIIEPTRLRPGTVELSQRYRLTPREMDVLRLALWGESTKRIASLLGLSVHTVKDHLDRVYEKVGVRGRKALLARFLSARPASLSKA